MKELTQRQKLVLDFLKGKDFTSPTEIGYAVLGGHSAVASPVCKKLVELGLLVRSPKGHYQLV